MSAVHAAEAQAGEAPAAQNGHAAATVEERIVSASTGLPLAPVRLSAEDLNVIRLTIGREANPSDAELLLFARVCERWQLDPFLGEVYMIRYEQGKGISIQPGRDGMLKAARRDPDFVGPPVAFAVHEQDQFEIDLTGEEPKVAFKMGKPPRGPILGGFAICHARGRKSAYVWCDYGEFNRGRAQWKSMPGHMIAKCAVNHSLKAQFGLPGLDLPENPDGPPAIDVETTLPARPAASPPSEGQIKDALAGMKQLGYSDGKIAERMASVRTEADAAGLLAAIDNALQTMPPSAAAGGKGEDAAPRGRGRPRSPAAAAGPAPRARSLSDDDMLGRGNAAPAAAPPREREPGEEG